MLSAFGRRRLSRELGLFFFLNRLFSLSMALVYSATDGCQL
jgi:hypothetical protein